MLTKLIVNWLAARELVAVNERELECTENELERFRRSVDPMSRFGTERLKRLGEYDSRAFNYFSIAADVGTHYIVFYVGVISGIIISAIGKGF